jgi:bacillolysin
MKAVISANTFKASVAAKALTPNAPVVGLRAASAARAERMADESSSANMAVALTQMSKPRGAFGPQFGFVKMTQAEATAAANTAMAACNNLLNAVSPRLHGLQPALAFRDELGQTHVRLNRFYNGIQLFAEQAIAHFNDKGEVSDITCNTLPGLMDVSTKPSITREAAEAAAADSMLLKGAKVTKSSSSLAIDKTADGKFHLCYVVELHTAKGDDARLFVDAASGSVIQELSFMSARGFIPEWKLKSASAPELQPGNTGIVGPGIKGKADLEDGEGNSIYLGKVKLRTTKEGDRFSLKDPVTGAETRDAKNGSGGSGSGNKLFTDNDNKWADAGDPAGDKPAVDAQYAAENFINYLKEIFDRDSLDGKGLKLLSNVHVRRNYVNAYWDGSSMNYGDGDGRNASELVDKDVGSHEPMHGVTEHTSGLVYRGESGALNEAGSDILGSAGFSWFLDGKKGSKPDYYLIGEDCWTPAVKGDALRYMNDPMKDRSGSSDMYSRDNYKTRYQGGSDNGGVHLNSGIANNAFFLTAEGGTNRTSGAKVEKGIGIEKALRIYYRAHTVYFTPNETFTAAREAMLKAAADLYGKDGEEAKVVAQAWSAVGVESKASAGGARLIG